MQVRSEGAGSSGDGVTGVVSHLAWVLGKEPRSSARTGCDDLSHWAISPTIRLNHSLAPKQLQIEVLQLQTTEIKFNFNEIIGKLTENVMARLQYFKDLPMLFYLSVSTFFAACFCSFLSSKKD